MCTKECALEEVGKVKEWNIREKEGNLKDHEFIDERMGKLEHKIANINLGEGLKKRPSSAMPQP